MTEAQAKKHLRSMLRSFTAGTVLHLFSELFGEFADEARCSGDEQGYQQHKEVEGTLFVVGLGIDAACPRGQQGGST
jgi:hypothetical protein